MTRAARLAMGSLFVCAGALGQPTSRAGDSPLVGVRTHDRRVAECVGMLEEGKASEAVTMLKDAIRDAGHGARGELNELRLGLGLVLLRSGDIDQARKCLLPLKNVRNGSDVGYRADILVGILTRVGKPKSGAPALLPRDAWQQALSRALDDVAGELTVQHKKIADAISSRRWSDIQRGLDGVHQVQERIAVFDLDELRLRQADLLVEHARCLAAEVRDINVAIAEAIREASSLSGQMVLKYDRYSVRRTYIPVETVARHNAIVDQIVAANAAGEKLVTEYGKTVSASAGRIKRDIMVRMSKSNLPGKKQAYGR